MEDDSDLLLLDFVETQQQQQQQQQQGAAQIAPPPQGLVMAESKPNLVVDTSGIFRSMEVNDNSKTPYSDATQVSDPFNIVWEQLCRNVR